MSEYVVDFGDKSSAFVGLAIAEAESHGATLKERVVRCRDCKHCRRDDSRWHCSELMFDIDFVTSNTPPDGFCAWGERRDA